MESMKALLREIVEDGVMDANRTDTSTTEIEGYMLKHDMSTDFPLPRLEVINRRVNLEEYVWSDFKLHDRVNEGYINPGSLAK